MVTLDHTDKSVVKLSHVPIFFSGMKEVRMQRNPPTMLNVVKPLLYMLTGTLRGMKGFIQKRNPMELFNMLKPLHITQVSKFVKEHKLGRHSMNGINVVTHLYSTIILTGMKNLYWRETL